MEFLNTMMLLQSPSVGGTIEQLAKVTTCKEDEVSTAISELKTFNVANIREQGVNITITCRRRERDFKIKKLRSEAGKISATKRKHHTQQGEATRSASASASASVQKNGECEGKDAHYPEIESPSWPAFWDFCQTIGLVAEWYARDRFLAAEQERWKRQANWRAYATRCRTWWESDGRPMSSTKGKRSPERVFPETALKEVERLIAVHPCNPQSPVHHRTKQTTELKAAYAALKERRQEIRLQISGVMK